MKNKKYHQQKHAKFRAAQRCGLNLSMTDFAAIIKLITTSKSKLLWRDSLRVTAHLVTYQDKELIAVYDSVHKSIATIMTKEMCQLGAYND